MPNHLAKETSPYLLQHKDNPVDWYPWGAEALDKAKAEAKPIFLSIGYAACHWCHVMAHESFEDPQIAAFLNQHFVSIKVDREERPDLDGIYMAAVVAMTQQGGWPMTVFLTPDLKPFYGGTYFPPAPRQNLPSFREVIRAVQAAWDQERDQVVHSSHHILEQVLHNNQLDFAQQEEINPNILPEVIADLLSQYDWTYGGWGRAPKFPQPMLLEFLLIHGYHGNQPAMDASLHALEAMSRGGMYDLVGGGFHRYSTDSGWLVPHFEKMLYDNAQLALAYLHAFLQTGDLALRQVTTDTLDYLIREMKHPEGGFYASQDADSADGEGAYYLWTREEIDQVAAVSTDQRIFTAAFSLPDGGNVDGRFILQRSRSVNKLAASLEMPVEKFLEEFNLILHRFRDYREKRSRPATDNKILLSWNALTITTLAQAGRYLENAAYLDAARNCANFILNSMRGPQGLFRSWRDGAAKTPAFLEDYASLVTALLDLFEADGNLDWYRTAQNLSMEMEDLFADPAGGFFDTSKFVDNLLFRPKDLQDNATPAGNSLAIRSLQGLNAYSFSSSRQKSIDRAIASIQESAAQYPAAFGNWLLALDFALNPPRQIAVVWEPNSPSDSVNRLIHPIVRQYRPRFVQARSPLPIPEDAPELLIGKHSLDNKPTVYVCQDFVCQLPVTDPDALLRQLE